MIAVHILLPNVLHFCPSCICLPFPHMHSVSHNKPGHPHHPPGRIQQHQRAYRSLQSHSHPTHAHIPHPIHRRGPYLQSYSHDVLAQALNTYHTICKTRTQQHKSMRQVANQYNIPLTSLYRHIHQYQSVLQPIIDHDSNNHNNNNHNASLQQLHSNSDQQYQHVSTQQYVLSHTEHPHGNKQLFTPDQEQTLVDYIRAMNELCLCLYKSDIIRIASNMATELGIKITSRNGMLSKKWWKGIYNTNTIVRYH
jgi:hypothetical protein